ncbi:MAG TPA: sulfatase-like hydrolase/transferase, partial [Thermoanaerobaculia bacterium]|nr:sulfatase-like hydrolase/transferase [Thermoanaerobaculia bacterium]
DERVDRALAWLRKERTKPFFLWLHLFDPHAPYDPPAEFRARYADRPYDGEVAFVDTQVARLLAALDRSGAARNTLVVLLSDHGESLGEHGEQTHGILLYDATLRVPLIFRLPGTLPAGKVEREPATLADVAPTILALAGLAPKPGIDGRDLFGSDRSARRLAAISESPRRRFGWAPLTAIRDGGWKYIAAPRPELYEVALDRGETSDRIGQEAERAAPLARAAREVEKAMRERLAARTASEPRREDQARLSALGYLSGGAAVGKAPDPKDVIGSMAELDRAYQLFSEGRLDEAEIRLRSLLGHDEIPSPAVLEGLARLARLRGRDAEAEALYLRWLEQDPDAVGALAQLILLAQKRGDHRLEVERARRLTALTPADGGASRLLAEALWHAGEVKPSDTEWRRGLAAAPGAGWLRLGFARFLIATGRQAEARQELLRIKADETLPGELSEKAAAEEAALAGGPPGGK